LIPDPERRHPERLPAACFQSGRSAYRKPGIMAKSKSSDDNGSFRPAHQVVLTDTIPRLRVLPADEPLPQSAKDFISETRLLVDSIRHWESLLLDDAYFVDGLADQRDDIQGEYIPPGKPFCEYVINALGLQVERLRNVAPRFLPTIPPYAMIPDADGVAGESYCEVALKLGETRWAWIHRATPYTDRKPQFDQAGKLLKDGAVTAALSQDQLGTWNYCRRLAEEAANEMPWFRANLKLPTPDCEKLLNFLAVESRRIKADAGNYLGVTLDDTTKSMKRAGFSQAVLFARMNRRWEIVRQLVEAGDKGLSKVQRKAADPHTSLDSWRQHKEPINNLLAPLQLEIESGELWRLKELSAN
jgi:hypothetical protein